MRSGPAKVPLTTDIYDVLPIYRGDMEDALTKETIPRKYEAEVRRYYDALDQGRGKQSGGRSPGAASE